MELELTARLRDSQSLDPHASLRRTQPTDEEPFKESSE